MRFKLTDGSIVDAGQDCGCIGIHDGPHWLYMNDVWRNQNQRLLNRGNIRGHVQEEVQRLREKRWEMERRGIEEILR